MPRYTVAVFTHGGLTEYLVRSVEALPRAGAQMGFLAANTAYNGFPLLGSRFHRLFVSYGAEKVTYGDQGLATVYRRWIKGEFNDISEIAGRARAEALHPCRHTHRTARGRAVCPSASKTRCVGRCVSVHSLRYSPSGLKIWMRSLMRSQT